MEKKGRGRKEIERTIKRNGGDINEKCKKKGNKIMAGPIK